MSIGLSKTEVLVLKAVCRGGNSLQGLVAGLGIKTSFASRVVASLEKKGLVDTKRQGTTKQIDLSKASHAQAFKELFYSRMNVKIEQLFSGKALDVLISMGDGAGLERLERECACSRPTLFRVLKKLRSAGVVEKNSTGYKITDDWVSRFAKEYASNAATRLARSFGGEMLITPIRKHVLVRQLHGTRVPETARLTGINALQKQGLEIIPIDSKDYYLNLDGRTHELSIEEKVVHALVLGNSPNFSGDRTVIAVFLKENPKLDYRKLRELAEDYGVSSLLQELRTAVGYYEKLREYK